MLGACTSEDKLEVEVYETSAAGNQLKKLTELPLVLLRKKNGGTEN